MRPQREQLGMKSTADCRLFMVFDGRWKMMHAAGGLPPMLFDLKTDPDELKDLGRHPDYEGERRRLYDLLGEWGLRMSQRVTVSDEKIHASAGRSQRRGILPFMYDGSEVDEELTIKYRGPVRQDHTSD